MVGKKRQLKPKRTVDRKRNVVRKPKRDNIAYHYDQQLGTFVKSDSISLNWFLSEVLQKPKLRVTKVEDDDIKQFIDLLLKSNLRMPDGTHSLKWVKDQINEKFEMAKAQKGEAWEKVVDRYRYILNQVDLFISGAGNREEIMKKGEEISPPVVIRTPNNMTISFEREEE